MSDYLAKTEPSEWLLQAADLIEQNGWVRVDLVRWGSYSTRWIPCYCAVGAIMAASGFRVTKDGAASFMARLASPPHREKYLRTLHYVAETTGVEDIQEWNDEVAESAEEVVGDLRRAAGLAMMRGE